MTRKKNGVADKAPQRGPKKQSRKQAAPVSSISNFPNPPRGADLVPIFVRLPAEHIVSLKFIFETYEEIGVVRTLNAHAAEAVILALEDTAATAHAILASIAEELSLTVIPAPESLAGDWLLAETQQDP